MINKFTTIFDKFISYLLVECIILVAILSFLGIILRQFQMTFLWLEPLIRHLVFVSALLGAALAVAEDKHIKIEVFKNAFEKRPKLAKYVSCLVSICSFFVLAWLAYASWVFYQVEKEHGDLGFLSIPTSFWIGSMTFGFSLMLLRLVLTFFKFDKHV